MASNCEPIYDIARNALHAATAQAFPFVRVDVSGRTARCTVIKAGTGKALDSFDLRSRRERALPTETPRPPS